jgi:Domain of unknown function (DUF1996)
LCALFVAAAAGGGPGSGARPGPKVNFLARCTVDHSAMDDPIVHYGHPGASHDHTFFGIRGVTAYSTVRTVRGHTTTCTRKSDTGAYWVPTLYRGGQKVTDAQAVAYYTLRERTRVQAYPHGLKIVAGDATATSPQPLHVTWWTCATPGAVKMSSSIPAACAANDSSSRFLRRGRAAPVTGIQLHVRFPDCWDGVHLDSPDHHSHMAYSVDASCPRGHRVLLPSLILIVTYPTVTHGKGVTLASGGQYSGHADFFNTWNQKALQQIVDACRDDIPHCGRH